MERLTRRRPEPLEKQPSSVPPTDSVSAAFWWVFEAFDQAVHNWRYVGAGIFTGAGFVLYASLCFSTVLLAVWETAGVVRWALGKVFRSEDAVGAENLRGVSQDRREAMFEELSLTTRTAGMFGSASLGSTEQRRRQRRIENRLLAGSFFLGVACIVLPVPLPREAFPLVWGALFFLLDPVNGWLGRRSLLIDALAGRYETAIAFAIAALVCGGFWEFWNYWAIVKWTYSIPYVPNMRLFEMPLPGYLGYLPFGLNAYTVTVLVVPTLMNLKLTRGAIRSRTHERTAAPAARSPVE